MTASANDRPGKARHVNESTECCHSKGMRVIYAQSDVSQLRERYASDEGQKPAEAVWNNCNVVYPLRLLDEWHTACAERPGSLIYPGDQ